jgi:hypothetical protein
MKPFVFEKVSLSDAREVLLGKPRTTGRDDWSTRRAAANEEELLQPETLEWLYDLPAIHQPHELAGRFVRIANRICELWTQPVRCSNYLRELMIVRRDKRQGFPIAIAREIADLAAYHDSLYPVGRSWTVAH